MNDRELLELAAKAAGYGVEWREWVTNRVAEFGTIKYTKQSGFWLDGKQWNPLTDDGDALRLAVKLRLNIDHNHPADQERWVAADRNGCEGCYAPVSCVEDDFDDESQRTAATRRAIVRAAAEIGKEMP